MIGKGVSKCCLTYVFRERFKFSNYALPWESEVNFGSLTGFVWFPNFEILYFFLFFLKYNQSVTIFSLSNLLYLHEVLGTLWGCSWSGSPGSRCTGSCARPDTPDTWPAAWRSPPGPPCRGPGSTSAGRAAAWVSGTGPGRCSMSAVGQTAPCRCLARPGGRCSSLRTFLLWAEIKVEFN